MNYKLLAIVLASSAFAAEGEVKQLRFSKTFVQNHYAADSATGDLVVLAGGAHPSSRVHASSCSGDDGELHVGVLNDQLTVSRPPSRPELSGDSTWGVVAELPNAGAGGGPAALNGALANRITFHGYFRVWNEGHDHGTAADSNPHHVFEVHPAWKFTATGTNFDKPALVKSIPAYSGYGISKLRPVFQTLDNRDWLSVFGDGDDLVVTLRESPNFFQFPAIIRSAASTGSGHEGTMDIFTNTDFRTRLRQGVRFVTITNSPIDGTLTAGKKLSLLGLFSVNLRRVLTAAAGASSEATAASVPDALEFFVFGKPLNAAVKNAQCAAEGRR